MLDKWILIKIWAQRKHFTDLCHYIYAFLKSISNIISMVMPAQVAINIIPECLMQNACSIIWSANIYTLSDVLVCSSIAEYFYECLFSAKSFCPFLRGREKESG